MSNWCVATLRAKEARDYEYTRSNSNDPWDATADVVATVSDDPRVRCWEVDVPHVYVYLKSNGYEWEAAEKFLEDYAGMAEDAVVLSANDTREIGVARYYPLEGGVECTDEYQETQSEDGCFVGEVALYTIGSRHKILAKDPFHTTMGSFREELAADGVSRT